ncbi:MAG: hypothetical protein R2755_17475 [Acidimicrobiales bacterium]
MAPHGGEQPVELDRLGEVVVGAGGEQPFDVAGGGVGGQHHHGRGGRGGVAAQQAEHLFAVEIGQVQIQQHQVGLLRHRQLEAEPAVHGGDEPHPGQAP